MYNIETKPVKQSNWIEIQGQLIKLDNIECILIVDKVNIRFIRRETYFNYTLDTEQEAQAEYNRIKTILGVE